MRGVAFDVDYESHTTSILLILWVVQALRYRKSIIVELHSSICVIGRADNIVTVATWCHADCLCCRRVTVSEQICKQNHLHVLALPSIVYLVLSRCNPFWIATGVNEDLLTLHLPLLSPLWLNLWMLLVHSSFLLCCLLTLRRTRLWLQVTVHANNHRYLHSKRTQLWKLLENLQGRNR